MALLMEIVFVRNVQGKPEGDAMLNAMLSDKQVGELWLWVTTKEPIPPLPYLKPDLHTLTAEEGTALIHKLVEENIRSCGITHQGTCLQRALHRYGILEEDWK